MGGYSKRTGPPIETRRSEVVSLRVGQRWPSVPLGICGILLAFKLLVGRFFCHIPKDDSDGSDSEKLVASWIEEYLLDESPLPNKMMQQFACFQLPNHGVAGRSKQLVGVSTTRREIPVLWRELNVANCGVRLEAVNQCFRGNVPNPNRPGSGNRDMRPFGVKGDGMVSVVIRQFWTGDARCFLSRRHIPENGFMAVIVGDRCEIVAVGRERYWLRGLGQ